MAKENNAQEKEEIQPEAKKICGVIMPISDCEGYPSGHWKEVYSIISEAIKESDFEPNIVSGDEAIGIIQERIVTNIYNNEMVVCDVSSRNPNVMFELGLRLAFDKPTVIIKDDVTINPFDTGPIEYIQYPSSLRYSKISPFQKELSSKLKATYKKSTDDPAYSPYLKNFGRTIVPTKIKGQEVTELNYLSEKIDQLSKQIRLIGRDTSNGIAKGRIISFDPEVRDKLRIELPYLIGRFFATNNQVTAGNVTNFIFEESYINLPRKIVYETVHNYLNSLDDTFLNKVS